MAGALYITATLPPLCSAVFDEGGSTRNIHLSIITSLELSEASTQVAAP
jgi:hypothetical protein